MPLRGARDLPEGLVGEGVVEVAGLAVEGVRVGELALEVVDQVGEVVARAGGVVGADA